MNELVNAYFFIEYVSQKPIYSNTMINSSRVIGVIETIKKIKYIV